MASPTIPPLIAHLRDCHARASNTKDHLSPPDDSPACCADALQQLAAICRDDGDDATAHFRAALVADDAQDGDETPESGQSLLELLLLAASGDRESAQSAALLATSVRTLVILPTLDLPPRRHDRLTQLALELATTALEAAPSPFPIGELRGLAVKSVCDLLRRPEEDTASLLMGTKVLALLLRDQSDTDAAFLQLSKDSVAALVRLLLRTVRSTCMH